MSMVKAVGSRQRKRPGRARNSRHPRLSTLHTPETHASHVIPDGPGGPGVQGCHKPNGTDSGMSDGGVGGASQRLEPVENSATPTYTASTARPTAIVDNDHTHRSEHSLPSNHSHVDGISKVVIQIHFLFSNSILKTSSSSVMSVTVTICVSAKLDWEKDISVFGEFGIGRVSRACRLPGPGLLFACLFFVSLFSVSFYQSN